MAYWQHLRANWLVAGHSLCDFLEHFLHGLIPCIQWGHQQPDQDVPNRTESRDDVLGGEPTFPNTRLAVRHIGGMLLKGGSVEEIREDYPYFDETDLEFAKLFV